MNEALIENHNKKLKDLVPNVEKAERALKTLRTMMKHDTVHHCQTESDGAARRQS